LDVKNNAEKFENGILLTNTMNSALDQLLKDFWSSTVTGKCPHCGKKVR